MTFEQVYTAGEPAAAARRDTSARAPGVPATLEARITRVSTPQDCQQQWCALEAQACAHFFHSWTWIGNWLQLVLAETPVYLFEASSDQRVVAMCFLTLSEARRKRGLIRSRQLRLNEYRPADCDMIIAYNGILALPEFRGRAWAALVERARDWDVGWDEIAVSSLPGPEYRIASTASRGLRAVVEKSAFAWVCGIEDRTGGGEAVFAGLKRKSRQQLRQSIRAFERLGSITASCPSSVDEALCYLDRMGRLHTTRWNAAGHDGSFANRKWLHFHRSVIREGFAKGQIELFEFCCNAEPIGYLYGHCYGDTVYMHQTGFALFTDNHLRPGLVCHLEAMRWNAARGMRRYDLLPDPGHSYKRFFAEAGTTVVWARLQRPRLKFALESLAEAAAALIFRARRRRYDVPADAPAHQDSSRR